MEHLNPTISTVCDDDKVRRRLERDALRLAEPGDATDRGALFDIDQIDRIVAEFGDDEAPASEVYSHMVDPARHLLEGNRALKLKRWDGVRGCNAPHKNS